MIDKTLNDSLSSSLLINDLVQINRNWAQNKPQVDNDIFQVVESTLIALHNSGFLTLPILDAVGETWRGSVLLDGAGCGEVAVDGRYLSEIALSLVGGGDCEPMEDGRWNEFVNMAGSRWGWK